MTDQPSGFLRCVQVGESPCDDAKAQANISLWFMSRWPARSCSAAHPYAVYVDAHDIVWVSDFGIGALLRFDPGIGRFDRVAPQAGDVWIRQLLGRPGEVWGADSAHDRLIRVAEHP
jgi:streptogramin lyase